MSDKKRSNLDEMKSNFLATMSHEIRTPMQSIYGLLELIIDEKPDAKVMEMARTAQDSASGLLEILDDILDIAKMDADKMALESLEVPIRLLVRGTLEAMAARVHGIDLDLIDDIHDDVPFVVTGDPKRLRQILINLVGNAVKFTARGSVTVRVTTQTQHITPVSAPDVGLRFEIIDTGAGMSAEVCGKLFQSFVQADSSTARQFGGTGLGLSICKKLVDLMEGQIGVVSTEGAGSTFWFEIPARTVSTEESTVELPQLDGISVLSVEDHPQGAAEIMRSLRSMGANVEQCGTYTEAVSLMKRRPYDVAVIDHGLPDGDGLNLMKEALQLRPAMGLVMYTVRDDIGLAHSLKAIGARYLTKPASRAGLGEAVMDTAQSKIKIDPNRPQKLLIAEDTASVRDVLGRQLDKIGVDYSFAFDGQEALDLYHTGEYGLLITDLHMPVVDGYQVIKAVRDDTVRRKDDLHIPVIALTADVQMAQREHYMQHGFDECLLKPVSFGQMKRLLVRWGLYDGASLTQSTQTGKEGSAQDKAGGLAVLDLDDVVRNMGAVDASAISMLKMFIDMTAPLVADIHAAQVSQDHHALMELGHSLKGAARSASCLRLEQAASDLQDTAEKQGDTEAITALIAVEFEACKAAIEAL